MSKYLTSSPERETGKPSRPKFCAVSGCLTSWNAKLGRHEPGFADVVFTLDDGTVIARCADHYLRHVYRSGHGVHCTITGKSPDMNIEMLHAYWQKLDEAEAQKSLRK